jgi:hypothetical protein
MPSDLIRGVDADTSKHDSSALVLIKSEPKPWARPMAARHHGNHDGDVTHGSARNLLECLLQARWHHEFEPSNGMFRD